MNFCGPTLILVCLLGSFVHGHNYLVNPVSRGNQRATQTGCRFGGEGNPTCAGPCDRTKSQSTQGVISINRGDTIDVEWSRHTHPGGFIRFAWSPFDSSDSHASFDQYVDHFVCKETGGCGPASASDPAGGTNGKNCAAPVTVPTWLPNGKWTLQWAYFGGWYNAGDYYACVDYNIVGGPTGTKPAVYFNGGDYTYPNQQKCLFYSTNALHVCSAEPCLNGTFPAGAQSGAPAGIGANAPPTQAPTPAPVVTTGRATTSRLVAATTGRSTTGKMTTGRVVAATTGRATTGRVSTPAPTPAPQTQAPTPASTPAPTPASTPAPTPAAGGSCSLGEQRCVGAGTYQTCGWATRTQTGWSVNQSCPSGLECHQVQGSYVWCY